MSFYFIASSVLILLFNRSILGNGLEEKLMMASYLLYFAIFQYVLLLFSLKYSTSEKKLKLITDLQCQFKPMNLNTNLG